MSKIKYPALLIFFALSSCVEDFQFSKPPQKPSPLKSAKACTDWYMILYDSAASTTSQNYMHTTCNDGGYVAPDYSNGDDPSSGLIAGNGPVFPDNPSPDDQYEYTSQEGDYVRYSFTSENAWRVIERIIPDQFIQVHPDTYAFLTQVSPFDGQVVFGQDDLYYTYEGGLARWHGEKK